MNADEKAELEKTLQEKISNNEINSKEDLAEFLTDDQLAEISAGGGKRVWSIEGLDQVTYYKWTGGDFSYDKKYLCPNCGRELSSILSGTWYRCGMCWETWYNEDKIRPNLKNWVQISKADYDSILQEEASRGDGWYED